MSHSRKISLPSQVTIYPKGFQKPEASGFHITENYKMKTKSGFHTIKTKPKYTTYVEAETTIPDPYTVTIHELGHHIWGKLSKDDKDKFILSLGKWWKRELPQRIGKEYKKSPFEKKVKEHEYLGDPSESFARMTESYIYKRKLPKMESEESWKVYKKIMKKYNGKLREDIGRLAYKTGQVSEQIRLKTPKGLEYVKPSEDFREIIVKN